jgi:Domain of unknown function (DUF4234)
MTDQGEPVPPAGVGPGTEPPYYATAPQYAYPPAAYAQAPYGEAAYGQAPYGQPPSSGQPPIGQPPPGWYGPGYGYPGYFGYGPPGRTRATGTCILLFVCTLGIYGYVYNYSVHDEMRRHSGRGIGGGIALLLTFIANIAMPFVTPAEVSSLYTRRGQAPPVSGWTGLWAVGPLVVGYVAWIFLIFGSIVAFSGPDGSGGSGAAGALLLVYFLVLLCVVVAGGVIWFVKTNRALNAYWESLGVPPAHSNV